jgi:phage terminase large subunit
MAQTIDVVAQFPPKCQPLFDPCRFKVMWGGRGSGKSWAAARALLLLGQQQTLRILCCREYMNSIEDSQHQLLVDQIEALHLSDFYAIEKKTIAGQNGTEFRFAGLKTNPSIVRSFEKVNIAWIEEAQSVSKSSWDTLIPTIRAPNSEIWVTMNPILESDNSYRRWIAFPPRNSWVQKLNWQDNPWFPDTLKADMEELKERHFEDYLHIYEGECQKFFEGAVYLEQMRQCEKENRITRVKYDASAPVECFFDLGFADCTAIWIAQRIPGGEIHCIDYIESNRKTLDWYLKQLSDKPYAIHTLWLPHDARAKNLGTGKSVEEMARSKGFNVRIVPNLSLTDGINAVRTLFPNLWFDKEACEDGLQAIRHYRYELVKDGDGGLKNQPVHDRWSHGNDALRYLCIGMKAPKKRDSGKYSITRPYITGHRSSWMQI